MKRTPKPGRPKPKGKPHRTPRADGSRSSAAVAPVPDARRPNVVLIITDQERSHRHWPPGWAEANLPVHYERLIGCRGGTGGDRSSAAFVNAFTATTECSPSRASLLTSSYPTEHGVRTTPGALDPRVDLGLDVVAQYLDAIRKEGGNSLRPNLLRLLSERGYDVAWKGKWHLSPHIRSSEEPSFLRWYGATSPWNPPDAGHSLSQPSTLGGGDRVNHDGRYLRGTRRRFETQSKSGGGGQKARGGVDEKSLSCASSDDDDESKFSSGGSDEALGGAHGEACPRASSDGGGESEFKFNEDGDESPGGLDDKETPRAGYDDDSDDMTVTTEGKGGGDEEESIFDFLARHSLSNIEQDGESNVLSNIEWDDKTAEINSNSEQGGKNAARSNIERGCKTTAKEWNIKQDGQSAACSNIHQDGHPAGKAHVNIEPVGKTVGEKSNIEQEGRTAAKKLNIRQDRKNAAHSNVERDGEPGVDARRSQSTPQPFFLIASLVNPHDVWASGYQFLPLTDDEFHRETGYHPRDFEDLPIELPPNHDDDMLTKPIVQSYLKEHPVFGDLPDCEYEGQPQRRSDALRYVRFYAHLHTLVDAEIGSLLDALDATGRMDNTIVVRMADHGELALSHGLREKRMQCYEETMGIPLVINYPSGWFGDTSSSSCSVLSLVSSIDILPTIAEFTGIDCSHYQYRGKSLVPFFRNVANSSLDEQQDEILFTFDEPLAPPGMPGYVRCIRTPDYKYAVYFTADGRIMEYEMYDLSADPHEMANLCGPGVVPDEGWHYFHERLTLLMRKRGAVPLDFDWERMSWPRKYGWS